MSYLWFEDPRVLVALGGLGLAVIVYAIRLVWKFGTWKGGVDEHRKTSDDHRNKVATFMKEIRDDFREVRSDIKKLFRELPKATVGSNSPTRLGTRISDALQAEAWAMRIVPTLAADVAEMEPWEIDDYAFGLVYSELSERDSEMSKKVSKYAYEFGVSQDNVLAVLQVVLRDALIGPEELEGSED